MNRRDYDIFTQGLNDAAKGSGLSDSPYGGRDGFIWRRGVMSWLDDQDGLIKTKNKQREYSTAGK